MQGSYGQKILCVETGKIYNTRLEAANLLHISRSTFSHYFSGKRETAGGYHWKFISDDEAKKILAEQKTQEKKSINKICPVEHCRFKKGNRPCTFFFVYKDGTTDCPNYKEYKLAQKAQEIEQTIE